MTLRLPTCLFSCSMAFSLEGTSVLGITLSFCTVLEVAVEEERVDELTSSPDLEGEAVCLFLATGS